MSNPLVPARSYLRKLTEKTVKKTPTSTSSPSPITQQQTHLPPPTRFQNGVGAFYLPLQKLVITYDHPGPRKGGSSRGVVEFIKTRLTRFAKENPQVEIAVVPATGHPLITGHYVYGKEKQIDVRNCSVSEVVKEVHKLRDSNGGKEIKYRTAVVAGSESVVPLWDPFHAEKTFKI